MLFLLGFAFHISSTKCDHSAILGIPSRAAFAHLPLLLSGLQAYEGVEFMATYEVMISYIPLAFHETNETIET